MKPVDNKSIKPENYTSCFNGFKLYKAIFDRELSGEYIYLYT